MESADEAGAVLLLALIFLLIGIIVVGALTNALTDDLGNSNTFKLTRTFRYAARDATQVAIQDIRYQPLLSTGQDPNASPPSYCSGERSRLRVPHFRTHHPQRGQHRRPVRDGCLVQHELDSDECRDPGSDLATCLYNPSDPTAAAVLRGTPLLQAVVTFDDYPSGLVTVAEPVAVLQRERGDVLGLYSAQAHHEQLGVVASGPNRHGNTAQLGLDTRRHIRDDHRDGVSAERHLRQIIEESGGTPASDNVVLPATVENVGSTSITVTSPAVTEGSTPYGITYFIAVTTPTGTRRVQHQHTGRIHLFAAVSDRLAHGLAPNTGSIAGGSSVAITGTGSRGCHRQLDRGIWRRRRQWWQDPSRHVRVGNRS